MKKLVLENKSYQILVIKFREWLDILGYSQSTIYNLPNHIREFLHYLEQKNIQSISIITPEIIKDYYLHLSTRSNQRRQGGLSNVFLNKHRQALIKFKEYLHKHNQKSFRVHLKTEKSEKIHEDAILTQAEIKLLFNTNSHHKLQFQQRDKAILTLLYSCGLRRSEAEYLNIEDVNFDKQRIHIKKAKNYKERFVPFNQYSKEILEDYLFEGRPLFLDAHISKAFLISQFGKRLDGQSMANRLRAIIKATNNEELQSKNITLHKLRHSIATHLLQQDMKIEVISQFLGHSSLESTQIYTHLIEEQ